jgi:translation initiation factor 3 subunit E
MVDSVIETYPEGKIPSDLLSRRDKILEERKSLNASCDPVVEIIEQEDVKQLMDSARDREGNSKVLEHMQQKYDVSLILRCLISVFQFKIEMLGQLYTYAKFQYECGSYAAASVCLYYYRNLVPHNDPNYLNALYGKLASEILCQEWGHAKDDLSKLRAYVDSDPFDTEQESLQHRAWLLHWSLFVYFNFPKGRDEVIEMFLSQQPYLNTIQIICPHLLRYLTVAVVASKNKQKNSLKDLIKIIETVSVFFVRFNNLSLLGTDQLQ